MPSTRRGWRCATAPSCGSARRPARSRCRTTARSASRAWPARRPTRPTSIRRSWQAGSVPAASRRRRCRCGRRSHRTAARRLRQGGDLRRADPRRARRERDSGLLVLDRSFETQSVDPMFLEPECGLAWYDAKSKAARTRARRAVALRGGGVDRLPARRGAARRSSRRASTRNFAHVGGGFGGTRPHAVRALCRAGGDVLSRTAGAAGA